MRPAIVSPLLCLVLATSCSAKHADANTREHMISNVHLIIKSWDKDGDGRLSRSEVQAMVDEGFRRMAQSIRDGQAHPELETQRQEMLAFLASQDTNHDGKLSKDEIFSGIKRCPSVNLDAFAPKH